MKKQIGYFLIVFFVGISQSYSQTRPYYGAMEYSLPYLSSVPPHYSGQPADVFTGYTLLDLAMRYGGRDQADNFISSMGYEDTAKHIIDIMYRIMDDNPLSFAQWEAVHISSGFHYINEPGHAVTSFWNRISVIAPDSVRTSMLSMPYFIAHIKVTDTVSQFDPTAAIAKHMVAVSCQILDPIKGKYIPACPDIYKAHKGNGAILSARVPVPASVVSSDSGTCMQFEYSLDWRRTHSKQSDFGLGSDALSDPSTGTWIKPDSEYVVFLHLVGVGHDNSHFYFTVEPLLQGSCAGMYPVRSGKVFDPNDDFGFGGSTGLTISDWKSRLRARIHTLINP